MGGWLEESESDGDEEGTSEHCILARGSQPNEVEALPSDKKPTNKRSLMVRASRCRPRRYNEEERKQRDIALRLRGATRMLHIRRRKDQSHEADDLLSDYRNHHLS